MFSLFQDEHVIKLTQELAQKLGFKIRKAYVRAEVSRSCLREVSSFCFVTVFKLTSLSSVFKFVSVFFQVSLKAVPGDGATKVKLLLL